MPRLSNLKAYYDDLLLMEKQSPRELVTEWSSALVDEIKSVFRQAYAQAKLKDSTLALRPGSLPQSVGNQIEPHIATALAACFAGWQLKPCVGSGYPDQIICDQTRKLPVEFKSTGQWSDRDTNRCVLTSSSAKLRAQFAAPIYHLLVTVKFDRAEDIATIRNLRLDFLSPSTPVNVRFEGSVTQRILARATHPIDEL